MATVSTFPWEMETLSFNHHSSTKILQTILFLKELRESSLPLSNHPEYLCPTFFLERMPHIWLGHDPAWPSLHPIHRVFLSPLVFAPDTTMQQHSVSSPLLYFYIFEFNFFGKIFIFKFILFCVEAMNDPN